MMERIAETSPRLKARITGLYLPLGYRLFPYITALGLLGAASLIMWLLVFGVNEQRWKEQASRARDRR